MYYVAKHPEKIGYYAATVDVNDIEIENWRKDGAIVTRVSIKEAVRGLKEYQIKW